MNLETMIDEMYLEVLSFLSCNFPVVPKPLAKASFPILYQGILMS